VVVDNLAREDDANQCVIGIVETMYPFALQLVECEQGYVTVSYDTKNSRLPRGVGDDQADCAELSTIDDLPSIELSGVITSVEDGNFSLVRVVYPPGQPGHRKVIVSYIVEVRKTSMSVRFSLKLAELGVVGIAVVVSNKTSVELRVPALAVVVSMATLSKHVEHEIATVSVL
jgi:hypothetical protein